jgi:hypothetical protein
MTKRIFNIFRNINTVIEHILLSIGTKISTKFKLDPNVAILLIFLLFGCVSETTQTYDHVNESSTPETTSYIVEDNTSEHSIKEETVFRNFSYGDFSVEHPEWADGDYSEYSILALQNGPCMLYVNHHNASITPLFNWFVNMTSSNENVTVLDLDVEKHSMSFLMPYQNISFKARFDMEYCNYETYILGVYCAEDFWDNETVERFLSSPSCAKVYVEPDYTSPTIPNLENTTYLQFVEEDYSLDRPDWDEGNTSGEQVFVFTRSACSVILNRYNTPADNVYGWLEKYVDDNESIELVHKNVPEKDITYDVQYGEVLIRARSKTTYCNYQSYNIIGLCEKNYYENNSQVLDRIIDSAKCAREYTFTPEITEVEQVPEEDRIVETDVGSEYGINAESVVIFFNSNPVFVKVMKNYDKVNLQIIDEDVDIKLKAKIDDGLITNVKEGLYSDADFTIIIPLDDALNIFNNADKLTLGNFLSFAINVKTDPPEMKNELIKQAFIP